jgi:hypothetical protein
MKKVMCVLAMCVLGCSATGNVDMDEYFTPPSDSASVDHKVLPKADAEVVEKADKSPSVLCNSGTCVEVPLPLVLPGLKK